MNPNQANPALSALKDIQLPAEVPFWPPAPGIWLLMLLALLLLSAAVFFGYRRLQAAKAHKAVAQAAMTELTQLHDQDPQLLSKMSALLKRTAISYGERAQVAGLSGKSWAEYLDNALPAEQRGRFASLLENQYRGQPSTAPTELRALCVCWLKCAPKHFAKGGKPRC
ncbi:DUF4381 domain-containing protein [Shewanella algae]|uniref:DUF4381 domain-containing protein n=1 Tax=Shewanella algae TaxID=38313 RepID=UPI0031F53025